MKALFDYQIVQYIYRFKTSALITARYTIRATQNHFEVGTRLDELKALLENVSDSYDNFVKCVC